MKRPTCRCYEFAGVFVLRNGEITHDKGAIGVYMEYPDGTTVRIADQMNYCPQCGAEYKECDE